MGKIFICYRRQDSQDMAGRLFDRLAARFGRGSVFKDVDSLTPSAKFPAEIRATIAKSDVFLPLVGERWLDARDAQGNRRLDDAGDYVRLEIEEALRQGVTILPVLLHSASMPASVELPESCRELAVIHAVRVRPDPDFKHDADRLVESISAIVRRRKAERQAGLRRRLIPAAALLVGFALVALAFSIYKAWPSRDPPPQAASHDALKPSDPPATVPAAAPVATPADPKTITNSIEMTLALIPAGEFMMGSPASETGHSEDEGPQHPVRITRPLYLGTTEVTQSQWEAVMRTTPWHGHPNVEEGPEYPATYVSWDDAVAFCQELSKQEGKRYRLPTEAEWEYACRAGTTAAYSFGDDASKLGDFAWYDANAWEAGQKYPHRAAQKRASPWGLYDMHGNVWEWCSDWYDEAYYAGSAPNDPAGPGAGSSRVARGGGFYSPPVFLRCAYRGYDVPARCDYGFRVVCER